MTHDASPGVVLIVDDDADARGVMKALLESRGYAVATAWDGNEALGMLRSGLRASLILLDLTLPNKDGFQFRRDQREDPALSAIPVVVYSGHHNPTQYATVLHANAYLQKPIASEVLLQVVRIYATPTQHAA